MSKQTKYHKFTVVESARRTSQARATTDAASPSLVALRAKLSTKGIDLKKCKGTVEFVRAVPKSKVLDGSSSSKRLIVKKGEGHRRARLIRPKQARAGFEVEEFAREPVDCLKHCSS